MQAPDGGLELVHHLQHPYRPLAAFQRRTVCPLRLPLSILSLRGVKYSVYSRRPYGELEWNIAVRPLGAAGCTVASTIVALTSARATITAR